MTAVTQVGRLGADMVPSPSMRNMLLESQGQNMSIVFKQCDGTSLIYLEGIIAIPDAAELKSAILQAFTSGQQLSFDLQNATELDITALQLLWAAEREAEIAGLLCSMSGRAPESIQLAAINAGFLEFPMVSK